MSSLTSDLDNDLPVFDGFPYLNIRVAYAIYHVILLPAGLSETQLADTAQWQMIANRLPVCLVLAKDRAVYYWPERSAVVSPDPPRGGNILAGGLAPAIDHADSSDEFRTRQNRLADLIARAARGYIFGDLTKGGHRATDEERQYLDGRLSDGTPRGLSRCITCGDWKGMCLDPSERFAGLVMTVHCYCDNHNRCARCNQLLYERRLNANYYNAQDRVIWHVPGFCGLKHRCSTRELSRRSVS